jgi:hypothetical protein
LKFQASFLTNWTTQEQIMVNDFQKVPWGTSYIEFRPVDFDRDKVEGAARKVAPNFDTPTGNAVALSWLGNGDTVALTKGQESKQFNAYSDDEEEAITKVLKPVADLWARLFPKNKP